MAKKRTVFLSSTGADLADYRKAVMDRLRVADHVHIDGMEIFGARDSNSEDLCRQRVLDCDIYVGLIGHYRGNDVFGDNRQRSYTELEYAVAVESGKPRLMYIVPDDFRPSAPSQTKKAERQQAAFRKKVLAGRVVSFEFGTADRLAAAVAVDLMNLIVDLIASELAQSKPGSILPGQAQAVTEAVAAVVEAAEKGDDRMARALALLEQKRTAEAEPLLREIAEEKTIKVERDRREIERNTKDAASAWRHLGAIAGFRDPKAAVDAYRKAVNLDQDDVDSRFWLGWLQKERGDLKESTVYFTHILDLPEKKAAEWHRYWSRLGRGDIEFDAKGDLSKALSDYRAAETMARRLGKKDPSQIWQRDLLASRIKIGEVLAAQGRFKQALKASRDSLAIAHRLSKASDGNAARQRDVSICYSTIGDVLVAQDKLEEALIVFRDALTILDRLTKQDPGYASWQRDLALSYERIGKVLVAQGKLNDALTPFRNSLAIAERLAKADPANANWQNDLAASHGKLGQLQAKLGHREEALRLFKAGRAVLAPVAERSGHRVLIENLRSFERDIAALEQ